MSPTTDPKHPDTVKAVALIPEPIAAILADFTRQTQDTQHPETFQSALIDALDKLVSVSASIPHPASGQTLARWQILAQVAATDLNLAKWFEAHLDALSILHELGAPSAPDGLGAVWAAEGSPDPIRVVAGHCYGVKTWCSGADRADFALMSYRDANNHVNLIKVDMHQAGISHDNHDWQALGMQHTSTSTVSFDRVKVQAVGTPNAYLERVGFWHGAAGVAACWYGATVRLADYLIKACTQKPHAFKSVYLGEVTTALAVTQQYFYQVARLIDSEPQASHQLAIRMLRAHTEQTARLVLERVGQALGAAPFCRQAHFARLTSDLPVFIRQTHGAFDWQRIGELSVAATLPLDNDDAVNVSTSPWQL